MSFNPFALTFCMSIFSQIIANKNHTPWANIMRYGQVMIE